MHIHEGEMYTDPFGYKWSCFENAWQSGKVWKNEKGKEVPHALTLKKWQRRPIHKAHLLASYPEFAKVRADWLVPGHPEASRPWQPTPTPQTPAAPLALGHGSSTPGTSDANTALGDRFGTNGQRNA